MIVKLCTEREHQKEIQVKIDNEFVSSENFNTLDKALITRLFLPLYLFPSFFNQPSTDFLRGRYERVDTNITRNWNKKRNTLFSFRQNIVLWNWSLKAL